MQVAFVFFLNDHTTTSTTVLMFYRLCNRTALPSYVFSKITFFNAKISSSIFDNHCIRHLHQHAVSHTLVLRTSPPPLDNFPCIIVLDIFKSFGTGVFPDGCSSTDTPHGIVLEMVLELWRPVELTLRHVIIAGITRGECWMLGLTGFGACGMVRAICLGNFACVSFDDSEPFEEKTATPFQRIKKYWS